MTIEEAIKLLEIQKPVLGCKEYKKPLMTAYDMAIKALEKQIPKKPIEIDAWGEYYKCPICEKYAVDNLGCKYKFCRECGQKFDWQTKL